MEVAVQRLLSELREGPVPLSSSAERAAQRERLLPELRAQVRRMPARVQRRRHLQHFSAVAAAAAIALVSHGLLRSPVTEQLTLYPNGGPLTLNQEGQARIVHSMLQVSATGKLQTSRPASLTTAQGIHVDLDAQTEVALDGLSSSGSTQLRLVSGKVECQVPRLAPGRRFSVLTPSAEITVVGTHFSVVSSDAGRTCVEVTEGRVEVRNGEGVHVLGPGASVGCEPPVEGPSATPQVQTTTLAPTATVADGSQERSKHVARGLPGTRSTASSRTASPSADASQPTTETGTLPQQSALLSRALHAERRGQAGTARELYLELLRRYPDSPLAPEADRGLRRVK